ncbi:hypothetical protein BC833DRAFT_614692 [Globomyces pollinis-pini]|nr:hypothetical protein BC833DRAFT_614692 [Globomyces pollinis-pini]
MILACQAILTDIPFVIPFERRVNLFRNYVKHDRKELNIELTGWMAPVSNVTIRRSQVFEDGYAQLDRLGPLLKNRIAISFVDKYGQMESGQDGGGLFKEFMTSCLKQAFDKNLGLFHVNEENLLYPAPTSYASELEQLQLFKFLGRIIGKALYEGILVDAAFASFFLSKWLGKRNYLYDLPSLDPEFYQSLMFLKNYAGDISDLCLTMTVTTEIFGQTTNVDLIKNGSNINVTAENRIQYIYLVANYKLNVQIARQCSAFFQGLVDLINPRWIKMFNEQELQILIGGLQVPIDINNLKQFTTYGGVFDEHHPTIVMFWNVIETFDDSQRSKLIKFITSCSRPPLLGFGELNPRLCIRFAGQDQTRLPTASTCVNLLKLPAYLDEETLRDKLIYSINAEAGFDLT